MIPQSVRDREAGIESARDRSAARQRARKGQISENLPLEITLYLVGDSPFDSSREMERAQIQKDASTERLFLCDVFSN